MDSKISLGFLCITFCKPELWTAHGLDDPVALPDAESGGRSVAQLQDLLHVNPGVAAEPGGGVRAGSVGVYRLNR